VKDGEEKQGNEKRNRKIQKKKKEKIGNGPLHCCVLLAWHKGTHSAET
jgi:hypothetical protein